MFRYCTDNGLRVLARNALKRLKLSSSSFRYIVDEDEDEDEVFALWIEETVKELVWKVGEGL
jgi:hypothetical protein